MVMEADECDGKELLAYEKENASYMIPPQVHLSQFGHLTPTAKPTGTNLDHGLKAPRMHDRIRKAR